MTKCTGSIQMMNTILIVLHENMLLFRGTQTIDISINRQSIRILSTWNLLSICGMSRMVWWIFRSIKQLKDEQTEDCWTKQSSFIRWFKFTLKPPYSGASERSLSAICDTSHWNFFVKFGLRTAWDISYDILLSLLKFVNFWRLQGRLSILAKIGCLQKIKVFSMKEQRGFDATWGFR